MDSALLETVTLQGAGLGRLLLNSIVTFFGLRFVAGLITKTPITQRAPQAVITDMFYWLFAPVARMISRIAVAFVVIGAALLLREEPGAELLQGFGPLAAQPLPLMAIEVLLIQDFISYWAHRLFHRSPWLWRVHAIHHSATEVGWSTTGRVHPVNEVVNYTAGVLPCLLLGYPLDAVLITVPVAMIYAIAAHADWDPPLGPLYHVLAGPRFHRWHHTKQHEGGDKNFSNIFSFWDRLFGTYYLPEGRRPTVFGLDRDPVPETFLGQLAYPFKRPAERSAATDREPQPATGGRSSTSPSGA